MGNGFLKVAVKTTVKKKIDILAVVLGKNISVFIGELVEVQWNAAKAAGTVSDAMLTASPEPVEQ